VSLIAAAAAWWLKFDRGLATVEIDGYSEAVGRSAGWAFEVRAPGYSGLREIIVRLRSGEHIYPLAADSFESTGWLGSGVRQHRLLVEADLGELQVREGPATLEVLVETHAWRLRSRQIPTVARYQLRVDRTPPVVQILSGQHNARIGGASVVVFRASDDTEIAEVVVEGYRFPSVREYFADPAIRFALFAVPQDLTVAARVRLRLADAVGNQVEVEVPSRLRSHQFRSRTVQISDSFLESKIPGLFTNRGLAVPDDLLAGFISVNRDLRGESERRLLDLARESADKPLWGGRFGRMAGAETMSAFADRRAYEYDGEIIDHQTHLGVDLASLRNADVQAAQNGTVVFAGDLGIYGNTVVIDHGVGVFSLYGHLGAIQAQVGQRLVAGEVVGQSGETGLAGGDHLHFSVMLWGIHIDPAEWWDAAWLRDHVTAKLSLFPASEDKLGAEAVPADGGALAKEGESGGATDAEARP
jgi:murein DD-endopeptidase MepM/ murein hydrolase activator NlpD